MNSKNFILSFILLTAICSSWWLVHKISGHTKSIADYEPANPDGFMTEAYYTHFTEEGVPGTVLYSPKITHYPKEDTAELTMPKLQIYTKDKQTWIITAKKGRSKFGVKEVQLIQDVVIKRIIQATNNQAILTTSALTAWPQEQYAHTDEAVTVIQPDSTITSVGMNVNLKTGNVQLLSKAQGIYQGHTP